MRLSGSMPPASAACIMESRASIIESIPRGSPGALFEAITTAGQPWSATTSIILGSAVKPETSFMTWAPLLRTSSAISGNIVSTEITASTLPFSASITGSKRSSSSFLLMGSAKRHVDRAPTSRKVAPSSTIFWATSSADSGLTTEPS
ncbi:hypothetical protein SDC9_155381 [bioreactor metagenome]|uniref:Uncharacterized protein n=1 Tax=bioreactor metagenome TaxID=1076179 RepID=A0A645F6K1_9ZZZZ